MKKIVYIISIVCAVALLTAACSKDKTEAKINSIPASPADYTGTIGIAKIISHPALDAVEQGVIDELKEQGYVNAKIDLQNANGEISTAASIASKYRSNNADVVLGIATPMALALANNLKDTPVVFSAVTDPLDAGLRKSNSAEDSNIAGVSDMTPVREQIELAVKLNNVKKLGLIYNAGEANSVVLTNIAQQVCDDMGIELIISIVTNTSEVKQAAEIVAPKVDAIYASTDNVVYASMGSLVPTAAKYGVPVIASVPEDNAGSGILAAYGVDYYNAGRETGKIIIRIINGEKAGGIPVKYLTEPSELGLYIDSSVASKMNITIPADLLKQANEYAAKTNK